MAKKVMVIDDSNAIRQSLVYTLKSAGYDAIEASNGAVALDLMKQCSIGLFISDVNMPEMGRDYTVKKNQGGFFL